ncbi:sugar ABC transporter substrate-binding protein [Pseudonocardia zijingensis]|uniref:Sugar ABC transporter substrate-binding protein n=1 Tax=Pseudonocardia zijingensis TaxID=153376 RepID=A0ABN1NZG6_9PSEU
MTTSRRGFLRLAGLGALAAGLPACSSVLPAPDTSASGFGSTATGLVRVWCRANTQEGLTALVESFNASQDRLTVELTPIPDVQYVTKLATAIRARDVPDLVDIDDINSLLFVYRDAFTDLTDLIAELDYADRLSPGHLALATVEGRRYAVPYLADNSALFCNTRLFERAGLDVDEATTDLDSLLDAARRITALGDDVRGWTFPGNATGALGFVVQPHVWAADTDLIHGEVGTQTGNVLGNEAVARMLEFYRALWVDGLVPPENFADDASRWGSDYQAGRIGMIPSNYSTVTSDADPELVAATTVRLLPGPDGGRAFFDGGDNMCIPRGAANASGAWEFVKFALDLPQQAALPEGGYTPVRSDVATPEFAARNPLVLPPLLNQHEGYAPQTLPYNQIYNQPDGPWLTMIRRAVFDGEIEAAMAEAQVGYDRILRQAQA